MAWIRESRKVPAFYRLPDNYPNTQGDRGKENERMREMSRFVERKK